MPIDIQCPDCEHVFQVPTSLAGGRTTCRSCRAALIVPEPSDGEPEAPTRPTRSAEAEPPEWETPIPFGSPGPIVGVLLIALLASVLMMGAYAALREPTDSTKPAPFKGSYSYATTPAEVTKPGADAAEGNSTAGSDREVILPDREVPVPKGGDRSSVLAVPYLPRNWMILRETSNSGSMLRLRDRLRGTVAASIPDGGGGASATASPSGRWMARVTDREVELHPCEGADRPALKWEPYPGGRKLAKCAILSDDRLLTVSDDHGFDLWAIPGGAHLRCVAAPPANRNRVGVGSDICFERSLLAIRDGSKIAVHSLKDAAEAPVEFAVAAVALPGPSVPEIRFAPEGKRAVAITAVAADAAFVGVADDRVEVFDLATGKRTAEWTLNSRRPRGQPPLWSAGAEALLVNRRDLGVVSLYRLSDGKLRSAIESGEFRSSVHLDAADSRVWFYQTQPDRLFGFDLPLRAPAALRKEPVWEYRAGVLELKKPAR